MKSVGKIQSAALAVAAAFVALLAPGRPALAAPTAIAEAPRLKPAAPGPVYTDKSDLDRLVAVKAAVGRRNYAEAKSLGAAMKDPTARSLAEWYYFEAEDPLMSIEAADRFLDTHPDWPSSSKIQSHAERRMASTLAPSVVLAFFETRAPLTGEGKVQLGRAQIATGLPEAGELHLRDAWVNDNFTLPDEQRFLANYGGRLTAEDTIRRVDRLLWAREVSTAKRSFSRLSSGERRRAEARAALLLGGADGERLYNALDGDDRSDPGVMLAAVRYFRRQEEEPRAISLARSAPTDPAKLRNPERWWNEQNLLMRWAMKNRQYADAYAMASHHGLTPGTSEFAEAEFAAGWIALRFLDEPERAEKHFAALTGNVSAPISLSRGWYWLGRAAEARGEADAALARYSKAAEQIYTFYGQLAAEKVGGPALAAKFERGGDVSPEDRARFASRTTAAAIRMLTDVRDDRGFLIFSYNLDDQLDTRGEFRILSDLAIGMNAPHVAVRAGKVAVRSGSFSPDIAYPVITVPSAAAKFAPVEVILGLSRQESEFNPRAYSSAGARGVMQLIPTTAQATAKKEGLAYNRAALLDDPHYNITIGSAHLSHLIDRFGGSWIMTFAGYNAGPNRVSQWLEAYGDPRSPNVDPLDWIEQIPFEETRNYVQRVLENSQIYRSRINDSAIAGTLSHDIERGGAARRAGLMAPIRASGALPDVQPRILALAEATLAAPAPLPDALSHVQVKPPVSASSDPSAKKPAGQRLDSAAKSGRSPARTNRRAPSRNQPIPPADPARHDPAPTLQAPVVEPVAEPASPVLTMDPIETAIEEEVENEDSFVDEGLVEPPDAASGLLQSAGENTASPDGCEPVSDFIAETAKEEASAADLNAGALAELTGDPACQRK